MQQIGKTSIICQALHRLHLHLDDIKKKKKRSGMAVWFQASRRSGLTWGERKRQGSTRQVGGGGGGGAPVTCFPGDVHALSEEGVHFVERPFQPLPPAPLPTRTWRARGPAPSSGQALPGCHTYPPFSSGPSNQHADRLTSPSPSCVRISPHPLQPESPHLCSCP